VENRPTEDQIQPRGAEATSCPAADEDLHAAAAGVVLGGAGFGSADRISRGGLGECGERGAERAGVRGAVPETLHAGVADGRHGLVGRRAPAWRASLHAGARVRAGRVRGESQGASRRKAGQTGARALHGSAAGSVRRTILPIRRPAVGHDDAMAERVRAEALQGPDADARARVSPEITDLGLVHHDHPERSEPSGRRRILYRMPKPKPDHVWYKWKGDVYMGYDWRHEEKLRRWGYTKLADGMRRRAAGQPKRIRRPQPSRASGSEQWNGWRWVCPKCSRRVRMLYCPLPAVCRVRLLSRKWEERFKIDEPRWSQEFACKQCHDVEFFSRTRTGKWAYLIAQLTGGLLYGHEVKRPEWFKFERVRTYHPQINRAPSRRREEVLDRLLKGWTRRRIALELGVSKSCVERHTETLYKQHAVHSREELVRKVSEASSVRRTRLNHHPALRATITAGAQVVPAGRA